MRLDSGQIEVLDDEMRRVLAGKTPRERLEIANGLLNSARKLLCASLKAQHTNWTDAQISGEASKRLLNGTH